MCSKKQLNERFCINVTFGLFRAFLQIQFSFWLGPGSVLYFRVRAGFGPDLVQPTLSGGKQQNHHMNFSFAKQPNMANFSFAIPYNSIVSNLLQ